MNIFNSKSEKESFLDNAKAARLERIKEKENHHNATIIQSYYRRYKVCKKLKGDIIAEFDQTIKEEDGEFKFIKATDAFKIFRKFLFFFDQKNDKERFDIICKYIISSMFANESKNSSNFKIDYTTVCLEQKLVSCWLNQVKKILSQCLVYLKQTRPELSNHQTLMIFYLNILINLTSPSTWTTFQKSHQTNIQPLFQVMNRFCKNILNYLVDKNDFYLSINELLMKTLCRNRILIKKPALIATLTLSIRPLLINKQQDNKYNDEILISFIKNVLSVPALLHHTITITDCHLKLFNSELLINCLNILNDEKNSDQILINLEANYSLCVLSNLVQFCYLFIDFLEVNDQSLNDFIQIVQKILEFCGKYVVSKQSSLTHWHSILGWFSQSIDLSLHDSLPLVKTQLQLLWNAKLIQLMFKNLLDKNFDEMNKIRNENNESIGILNGENSFSVYKNFFRKAAYLVSRSNYDSTNSSILNNLGNNTIRKLMTPELFNICNICSTYVTILKTLSHLRLEILTGICYQEKILINLWKIIWSFVGKSNLNLFLNSLELDPKVESPEFQLLILVCDCSTHLITLLDDKEVYEEQKPFQIQDLIQISSFLNHLIFRIIYVKQIDIESTIEMKYLFNSLHALLILLYRRDSRREFASKDHWLIKEEIKISNFMKDLDNGKKHAELLLKKIPHILPHKERVILFKKYVAKEKELLGLNDPNSASLHSTLVTVHRSRILEDSYQHLNKLQPQVLKSTIRVKFINEQGLSESGIDQNGVFKEFLEETMRKVLDPSLNLFAVTIEQRLYPSPTSNLHENHLSLFEFSGKMLGKAVYEGIVIDAPFASFFLNQILPPFHNSSQSNNQPSLLYSSIDQLPSLDPELYKSLCYIKHYPGDVEDFNLTFSVNENILGELVTHELISGGRSINVTKENKISYIHLMAHFRMHKQIDEQCNAFVKGFRSIISPDWLAMFSTPELQRLISGDNIPIDLNDLRKNTKYYGGFHNNHRLINWFWDILQNDFTNEELALLLKFVTSCSCPPLLGFAHLQPSFSIRCVEVAEDLDVGDTVGSVLRGFLTISNGRLGKGKKNENIFRLPTSSTCFNLLKLPNYQKKSVLRDKLKYAIKSGTGFELS